MVSIGSVTLTQIQIRFFHENRASNDSVTLIQAQIRFLFLRKL
jgi:hypothetical protein